MNMKIGFMMLPLICAVGGVQADGHDSAAAPDQTGAATAPAKAQARDRMATHKPRHLPRGDLRHCLDLKTSEEIIRCSETGRSNK